ncbi:hypothetical protein [Raoultella terrigena]|uniref:hypothetical protein n=1 Tax=Raoultella terrigena TaxID=577 RepID=UPI0030DE54E5
MNLSYFRHKFQDAKFKERLLLTLTYDDPLLCVVSSHLMLERMLEIWIEAYSDIPCLLDNAQLSFSQKLKMCKNCKLPTEIASVISKINKFRNTLSHKFEMSDLNDLETKELLELIQKIEFNSSLDDIHEFSINSPKGMIKIKDASNNQKVVFAALIVISAMFQSTDKLG